MTSARVRDFAFILTGLLTQYDLKESAREVKRSGQSNVYRLGHLLEAAQGAESEAAERGILDRDDPEAIQAYREILKKYFIHERGRFALPPLRQLEKRMDAWVEQGKLPKYGTARSNPVALAMRPNLEPLGGGWVVGAVLIAGLAAYIVYDAVKGKEAAESSCPLDMGKLQAWSIKRGYALLYLFGWKGAAPPPNTQLVDEFPQLASVTTPVVAVLANGSFWLYQNMASAPQRRDDLRAEYCAYAPPSITYRTPGTAGVEHFLL